MPMTFDEIEAFLVLAEEQHFGRTATRLHLSQSRVSRLIAALERDVGGLLFERTSRRVSLSPLGARLRADLAPAYEQVLSAVDQARDAARGAAATVHVGFTITSEGPRLNELVSRFELAHPDCVLDLREVALLQPYEPLRRGEIDVLVYWALDDEADLAYRTLDRLQRVLAVAAADPFATRDHVSVEELADRSVAAMPDFYQNIYNVLIPPRTPSGRVIPRTVVCRSMSELWSNVSRGRIVHPTVTILSLQLGRNDIRLIPIPDMPPMTLGVIWRRGEDTPLIRALAETASRLYSGRANGPDPAARSG